MNKYWKVVKYPLRIELIALAVAALYIGVLIWQKAGDPLFWPVLPILLAVGPVLAFVLLVRKCYENDFGFRNTLLVMFVFWFSHLFVSYESYVWLHVWAGELHTHADVGQILFALLGHGLVFAALSLIPALVTAYIYGLVRIWLKSRAGRPGLSARQG